MKFLANKKYSIPLALAAILAVFAVFRGGDEAPKYEFVTAERGTLTQSVSVTGKTKPVKDVDLAFENGGRVSRIYVSVGDSVESGSELMKLEDSETSALLAKAEASLRVAQAKLDELKRGTRKEEIRIQEVNVSNAKTALNDAEKTLVNKIQDAFTKSDDAVRTKIDQFYSNARTNNASLDITVSSQLEIDLEWERPNIERMLTAWEGDLESLTAENAFGKMSGEALVNLARVKSFADKNAEAVSSLSATTNLSQATIDKYKSDIASARSDVNTAINNLTDAEGNVRTAKSNLTLEENKLALKLAGSTAEEIAAQEAKVSEALALVSQYKTQLRNKILTAPISGIVTRQDARVGEIVSAENVVVSIISGDNLEIEANVPEIDIPKVKNGDTASVTLDAYGDGVVFDAVVTKIDPAETVIEGVSTYLVTFKFTKRDGRVRPGMTANIDILTAKKENVISIPQRSIIRRGGGQFVRILDGKNAREAGIKTGIKGSSGEIEVTQGVNEGDKVIIFEK